MKRLFLFLAASLLLLTACGSQKVSATPEAAPLRESVPVTEDTAGVTAQPPNLFPFLSVPTCVTKVGDTYFIVDCYHDRVLYHDNLTDPITDFSVLPDIRSDAYGAALAGEAVQGSASTGGMKQPHTLASDGVVFLVDDTENNRVLIYEETQDGADGDTSSLPFTLTQMFDGIGVRPHYTVYEEATRTFYVWSSFSGELYLFQRREEDNRVCLISVLRLNELAGVYVRSFTIEGEDILFTSGLPVPDTVYEQAALPLEERASGVILRCDKETLEVKERYAVPDDLAGMVQILPVKTGYLITVSTDLGGSADAATMLYCESLSGLAGGDYEEVYDTFFLGGGTPYYINEFDTHYYLTEHRLPGHSIWQFDFNDGIQSVKAVY